MKEGQGMGGLAVVAGAGREDSVEPLHQQSRVWG